MQVLARTGAYYHVLSRNEKRVQRGLKVLKKLNVLCLSNFAKGLGGGGKSQMGKRSGFTTSA